MTEEERVARAFDDSRMIGERFWLELPLDEQQRFGRFASALTASNTAREEEVRRAAARVLEWWPVGSEDTRAGKAKGSGFAEDIRALRAALSSPKEGSQ